MAVRKVLEVDGVVGEWAIIKIKSYPCSSAH